MRHLKSGKKLNRTASHRKATLQSLASNLIEHKRIKTTTAKAKALRPYAEKLISKAKHALQNEQNGSLPEGQSIDIHTRRIVARELKRKDVLQELFDSIAPVVAERDGGYTRIIKLGSRRGDSAEVALIELVDWSNPQEGGSDKPKKKKTSSKTAPTEAETTEVKKSKSDTTEAASESTEETPEVDTQEATQETSTDVIEDKTQVTDESVAVEEEKAEEATEKKADATEEAVEEKKATKEEAEEAVEAKEETKEKEESDEEETDKDDSDDKKEEKKD